MSGLEAIDLLARVRLEARRAGVELRIVPSQELGELITFCGLTEALGVEPRRQPEEREEPFGVEEERELDDAPALDLDHL